MIENLPTWAGLAGVLATVLLIPAPWLVCWVIHRAAAMPDRLTVLRDRLVVVDDELLSGEIPVQDRWELANSLRMIADQLAPIIEAPDAAGEAWSRQMGTT